MRSALNRLRPLANGKTKTQRAVRRIRRTCTARFGLTFCAETDATPVAICTVRLPEEFAATDSVFGLNVHAELAGSELQAKVKVPLEPLIGAKVIAKLAICPLAMVWLDWPCAETEKS